MFVEIPKNKCGVRKNCSCDADSDSRTLSGINGSLQRPSRQMKGSTKVKKVSRTILDEGKLSNLTADSKNSLIFFSTEAQKIWKGLVVLPLVPGPWLRVLSNKWQT